MKMLYGKRVRLRAIEREDIPAFLRWFNDPEVRQWLTSIQLLSRAKEERWFEEQLARTNDLILGIEVQVDQGWTLIGNIGLHGLDWKNRRATLGIVIGERDFWDKGFGTEAIEVLLRYAFLELGLHRVELEVFEENRRARRCYEKVGFREEGIRREAVFRDGRFQDLVIMSILAREFSG